MRSVVLLGLLAACGGDDPSTDGAVTDGGPTVPTTDTDLCDGIPQFDLATMGCDQVVSGFEQTMSDARGCNTVEDCQVLDGQCESFVHAACWYPTNLCVDQGTVSDFAGAWAGCPTEGSVGCSGCGGEPEVQCLNNKCAFVTE